MVQRKEDYLTSKGLEISGPRMGGGFGRGTVIRDYRGTKGGAFDMPKDASGQSAPLNRKGVTDRPVEKLESPSREFVKSLSDDAKRQLQEKAFPRKIEDAPKTKMQQRMEQRKSAYEDTQGQALDERNRRRQERADRFGVSWRFNKGGMIHGKQCRDYGK